MAREDGRTGSDVVVVGAGSAGCAVAATLADAGVRVTLVEAGPSTVTGRVVGPDAHSCDLSGRLDWRYTAAGPGGRRLAVPRGRVLGGSSVINTCVALRPDPDSFDRWSATVGGGWSWADVLGDLRAIEHDVDLGASPHHGTAGPLPIVRWRDDELEGPSAAFVEGCVARGHRRVRDLNEPGVEGVGVIPMNRVGSQRASSDRAFLTPSLTGAEGTLRIVTAETADRVVLDRGRAVGVETVGAGGTVVEHRADHVVLCAGSYGTPAILQRSGLGPAALLRGLGVDVVADLPTGEGLHDHPLVPLPVTGPPGDPNRPSMQVLLKATTPGSDVANDVQLTVFNRVDLRHFDPPVREVRAAGDVAVLAASLQHSEGRGAVRVSGRDPRTAPWIELEHLAHAEDRRRMRLALRELAAIAATGPMRSIRPLDGVDVGTLDDAAVDELAALAVGSSHHPMGTAAMAAPGRPGVVDPDLRVRGVDGLSVADASVVPVSINANIHLTCTMIGRRHGRELLAAGRRGAPRAGRRGSR